MLDLDTHPELAPGMLDPEAMTLRPRDHYTHILVLRELRSHALLTTNGEDADLAHLTVAHDDARTEYTPALMFMRKQTGSDRRTGKAWQRRLGLFEDDESTCTMQVTDMCRDCPECILYGSAAGTGDLSITSRVMYDTAYSLRDATVVVDETFQNAPGNAYAKSANSTIWEADVLEPGTMFPCVITLRDATPIELAFVLGITRRNKRYGGATSRLGRTHNHILDLYVGSEEGPANLDLTRETLRRTCDDPSSPLDSVRDTVRAATLNPRRIRNHLEAAFEDFIRQRGLELTSVSDDTLSTLLETATGGEFVEHLRTQRKHSRALLERAE